MTQLKTHWRIPTLGLLAIATLTLTTSIFAAEGENPFLGRWALTIPGGGAGWLEITQQRGYLDGSILWGGGSVVPVSSVFLNDEGDTLYVTRVNDVKRRNAGGKVVRTQQFTEAIIAKVSGDDLELTQLQGRHNGHGILREEFTGHRIPPVPPAPDLSQVEFGNPIKLFNGENLDGWRLTDPHAVNGWSVEDGVLINRPVQEEGAPHKNYGNLRTDRDFEDFNLTLETRVSKNQNSGIYLRGIYEVQVADTYGRKLDPHNMGAVYSRITPLTNAEKPAGEWQTFDITLVKRHVTVILNGTKIIDNQPLMGCTGGALWSDESRPGPIYLQGDHTGIEYRNIVLRPVVE
jgi:3-keto-disaccharide hydrolase